MRNSARLLKLEDIEHSYFCYEEDCPVCGGLNFRLGNSDPGSRGRQGSDKNLASMVREGWIWKLRSDKVYPLHVLVVRDMGVLKKCVRVSEFVDFMGHGDIIADDWLVECWNRLELPADSFASPVERVEDSVLDLVMKESGKKNRSSERESDTAVLLFRNLEVQYQEYAVSERARDMVEELKQKCSDAMKRIRAKIKALGDRVPDFIQAPWPDTEPGAALTFGVHGRHGIHGMSGLNILDRLADMLRSSGEQKDADDETVLLDEAPLHIVLVSEDREKQQGRLTIRNDLGLLPTDARLVRNGRTVRSQMEKDGDAGEMRLIFPLSSGKWMLKITYPYDSRPLELGFRISLPDK
jgi:hypothetical protein